MFYSQFILAKKGPLGTIWIAAHLERKLRKNQVADTDIGVSVDSIISPDVPIALRLSSHLLVGVVRIYNRKVNYLFDDCSEALLKVKQAFRSTAVDLPPEESKAPYHSITLPETFDLDDFELPDNDILHGNYNDHHISSREQITLQDNMEGVSYSTSKFGLDERFGDGDALGLDLDEELLLEKIGTGGNANESADPQASMSTLKQDGNTEERPVNSETMVDGVDEYNGLMDYTEGPCTPGLVEEPNLSNVKEASACDDHLESECHLESTVKENSKDISSEDKPEEVHSSSRGDTMLDAIPQENACKPVFLETEESMPQVECTSVSESDKVEAINNDLESADNSIKASDTSINKDNASFLPVNHNQGSDELCLEKGPEVSEGVSAKEPSALEIFGSVENTSSSRKLAPNTSEVTSDNQVGSFTGNHETEALHKNMDSGKLNLDANDKDETNEIPTLRACTIILEQSDPSETPCSVPVGAEPDNAALATSEIEDTVNLGKEDCGEPNQAQEYVSVEAHNFASGQVNSTYTRDELVENLNKSVETELPAPEKLLSVPEGHANLHKDMLNEFSPRVFVGHDEGDAGSKTLAGKKRTFTESTLTDQSLNSVESSRQVRGKRTIGSVPDDDDLLSSILVGGKSSVFKVKPTPRLSEVTSMKRTGSTTRDTAPKRKLLMDDTMVLHGDMIRQQLTSTEDIRRLRKKAPCTYSEISLIKKQHLEDQFFLEALFTGMSVELALLHSQEYDLSRISVYQNKETGPSLENLSDPMLAALETTGEPKLAFHDDINGASIETDPHLTFPMNENGSNLVSERAEDPGKTDDTEQGQLSVKDNELAEPSENPLVSDYRLEEVDCAGTEVNISQEQIKDPEISQQEILPDVAGGGISSLNDDAVNPIAVPGAESLEPVRNESGEFNENGEANYFVNADAAAAELDSAEVNDGQAIDRDGVTETDGNVNGECKTELEERDIMMSDMERDGDFGPVPDAKNGELEYDVLTDVHNVVSEEQNIQVSELGDGSLRYGEDATLPEAFQTDMIDAEFSGFGLHERDEYYSATGNDTEFLNVDDDEINEIADDHVPDAEEARITENSGWSSRTRAVSKYLQTAFVKEAECGRKSLSIDNLLTGKSRKEASRMFFETLVLKTRNYVHVEQRHPFDDVTIKPRTKLMKSDF